MGACVFVFKSGVAWSVCLLVRFSVLFDVFQLCDVLHAIEPQRLKDFQNRSLMVQPVRFFGLHKRSFRGANKGKKKNFQTTGEQVELISDLNLILLNIFFCNESGGHTEQNTTILDPDTQFSLRTQVLLFITVNFLVYK